MMRGTEYRTTGAALDMRDLLRGRILPAADRLRAMIGDENRQARALVDEIRGRLGAAVRWRFAMKNRRGGPRSR
jgi:hypothetical protein